MSEKISVMISQEDLTAKIKEMAARISSDYAGKELHLICILKGSIFFTCELAKYITVPVTMDFMTISSYGAGTKSSGKLILRKDLDEPIKGKHVLVIEDIIDSGRTLRYLLENLSKRGPESLKLCTMLDKPDRRVVEVDVDYTGFVIPNEYVIGFGLDSNQRFRNLPYIGILESAE